MLLNYEIDTKDETLTKPAIELRKRVAGRKLRDNISKKNIDEDTLLAMKEASREELKEHGHEVLSIELANSNQRVALGRLDHQMTIHKTLGELDRDLSRVSRLNKTRYDALGDLTKRINTMRSRLFQHSETSVEAELTEANMAGNKSRIEAHYHECTLCQRKILTQLYEAHLKTCSLQYNSQGGEEIKPPVYDVNQTIITQKATFKPQPPRNLYIKEKGSTYIVLAWEPCVIDGGLPVTDYEVTFIVKIMEMDKKTGKYKTWTEKPAPLLTTHWCMTNPICHHGYKLTGLRSGAEYTSFRVRCRNLRGWSDYCEIDPVSNNMLKKTSPNKTTGGNGVGGVNMGAMPGGSKTDMSPSKQQRSDHQAIISMTATSIRTSEVDPPSCPLFFKCSKLTSSCIYLDWQEPMYTGGQVIIQYIIHYTVIERHISSTSRNILIDVPCKYVVDNVTSAVVRNIGSDLDVKDIYIKAVNKMDIVGDSAYLDNLKGNNPKPATILHTNPASMYSQIRRQIHMASKLNDEYIETDFFTGVTQKMLRIEFLRECNQQIKQEYPDPVEQQEAAEWAAIVRAKDAAKRREEIETQILDNATFDVGNKEKNSNKAKNKEVEALMLKLGKTEDDSSIATLETLDEDEDLHDFTFPWRQRKAHFIKRIKILEERIKDYTDERYEIDKNRTRSTLIMKKLQTRTMMLRLEIDNIKHFKGEYITSSILHGASMRYEAKDFIKRVDKEYSDGIAQIADLKVKVINGENRKARLKVLLTDTTEFLKNRRAEFYAFQKTETFMQNKMFRLADASDGDHGMGLKKKYFRMLVLERDNRRYCKDLVNRKFTELLTRKIRSAWCKWNTGSFEEQAMDEVINKDGSVTKVRKGITGVGTKLLGAAKEKRQELQDHLRRAIAETADLKEKWNLVSLPPDSRKRLLASASYPLMQEGINHTGLQVQAMTFLYEGDGMLEQNKFADALRLFEAQIIQLRAVPKGQVQVKYLAMCHGRMGRLFLKQEHFDRSIVEFDRQLSLAKEVDDKFEAAEAFYGMGRGYYFRAQYDYAIRYLNMAQVQFQALGNYSKCCNAMIGLRDCYTKLHKDKVVQIYTEQISRIGDELTTKMTKISNVLENLKGRLVATQASIELSVDLERTTHKVIMLRKFIDKRTAELAVEEEKHEVQEQITEGIKNILVRIDTETNAVYESDELELWSDLVHDQPQMIEVEELKTRLKARKLKELAALEESLKVEHNIHVLITNAEDDIEEAQAAIDLEGGALAVHARKDKPFRCMAYNPGNAAGNEVTGTATGGVESFVAAEGKNIHLFNNHSGELEYVFVGDDKHRLGEKAGHTGVVTCLAFDFDSIFSGGADEVIIGWDVKTYKKTIEMHGHEGSITVIAVGGAYLMSGAADCTIRFWEKMTGTQVRVLTGHIKSVMCLDVGLTWMASGGADNEVRVWEIKKKSIHTITAECTHRLIGHEQPITVVKYGKLEVMSGDALGRIFIWWLATGKILRKCQVHKGPVRCMQFDAIHIVSGGVDNVVAITDIATGEVLQSLRGHTRHILEVAFDSTRILSASADNTLKYWQWGKQSGPLAKYHVINKGETLVMVSKLHGVSVEELMKWNGIYGMAGVYPGMKIIVKKGDPNVLTDAEKVAEERDRRKQAGMSFTSKKIRASVAGKTRQLTQYNRVQKVATDMDKHSLSNRLFGRSKHNQDILPDLADINKNKVSLYNRLARTEEEVIATTSDLAKHEAERRSHTLRAGYVFTPENRDDEWGEIADQIALTMLELFCEYEAYDLSLHAMNSLRDKKSTIGRIFAYQMQLQAEEDARDDAEEAEYYRRKEAKRLADAKIVEEEDEALRAYEAALVKEKEEMVRAQMQEVENSKRALLDQTEPIALPSVIQKEAVKFKNLVKLNDAGNSSSSSTIEGPTEQNQDEEDEVEEEEETEGDKAEQAAIVKQRQDLFKHLKEDGVYTPPAGSPPGSPGTPGTPALLHDRHVRGRHSTAGEFTVTVIPDPLYGLGMKLKLSTSESSNFNRASGTTSVVIVDSFKSQPSTSAPLPVEASGLVHCGDLLLRIGANSTAGLTLFEVLSVLKETLDSKPETVQLTFRHSDTMQQTSLQPGTTASVSDLDMGLVSPPRAPEVIDMGAHVQSYQKGSNTDANITADMDVPIIYPVIIPTEALSAYREKQEQEEEEEQQQQQQLAEHNRMIRTISGNEFRPHAVIDEGEEDIHEEELIGQSFGSNSYAPLPPIPIEISSPGISSPASEKKPVVPMTINPTPVLPPITPRESEQNA